jgi:CubicO group peptidase (beta-lactamase class C family)
MRITRPFSFSKISMTVFLILVMGWSLLSARDWGDLSGTWDGIIEVSGTELGIEVTFIPGQKIEWTGDIDIAVQGAKNMPLGDIMIDGTELSFCMPQASGDPEFRGELSEDGMTVVGTFLQGGTFFPFTMTARDDSLVVEQRTTLHDRLNMIREFLDTARVAWDVPGLSIAIMWDGIPVLSVGNGSRNLIDDLPATRTTLYPIGSATQTFTAAGLADLVGEGRLDWDEPLRTYLPEFALADETASRDVTIRDLLANRTGLAPHQALNYVFPYNRAELVTKLQYVEPNAPLRTSVQPQDLMYTLGGYLTGQIKSQTWEEAIRRNLFGPLRMGRTGFSVDSLRAEHDHASPYRFGENGPEAFEMRRVKTLAPAVGIHSSVVDLSRWLEFWLRRGTTGQAARVMPARLIDEMITPQAVMPLVATSLVAGHPERLHQAAALGWSVEVYRGHRRVFNDGFIDGYSSILSFLPDDDLSVIVLCNMDRSPLPEILSLYVTDLFLNLEPIDFHGRYLRAAAAANSGALSDKDREKHNRRDGTKPSHKADEYAATYEHPAYGLMTVTADGKKLTADLNGHVSELRHWHYDTYRATFPGLTTKYDLTFATNDRGNIDAVTVLFEPRVAPVQFTRQPLAELSNSRYLDKLVGKYDLRGTVVTIKRRRDELFYIVPGQRERLLVPSSVAAFTLEGLASSKVEFIRDDQGVVLHMLFDSPEGAYVAPRLMEVAPGP